MAGKEKWTARGTGKCPRCSFIYSTFKKPANCSNCDFFLGGKYVPQEAKKKKRKLDNPEAVTVCSFGGNTLFSMKLTTRDDRCFCLVSDTSSSRLCYFGPCKNYRSVAAASGQLQLDRFACEHLNKVKDSVGAKEEFHLTAEQINNYPGGADIQRKMEAANTYAKSLAVPQVVRVSETSYAVCSMPDTYAENGFVHVKKVNGVFTCAVKNCRVLSGGRQLKTRHVCLHLHLLSCSTGFWKTASSNSTMTRSTSATSTSRDPTLTVSTSTTVIPTDSASAHGITQTASTSTSPTQPVSKAAHVIPETSTPSTVTPTDSSSRSSTTSSVSRISTIKLNLASHYPYHIPLHILHVARAGDCRTSCCVGGGWPKDFIPADQTCRLCGSGLHPPRCHPGSQGKAVLITNVNPFLPVNIKVKICQNGECQAMHQPQVYGLGKFTCT